MATGRPSSVTATPLRSISHACLPGQMAAKRTSAADGLLVAAEIDGIEGRPADAERQYEAAIQRSRRGGFLQCEALASELAGEFYSRRGLATNADAHLRNALECYERWGCVAKTKKLQLSYPHLRSPRDAPGTSDTVHRPVALLDAEAVDKASHALAGEMALPDLLAKLMRIAVEHAAAERGFLILLEDGEPYIEAMAATGAGTLDVAVGRSTITAFDVLSSALRYVLRTRERLVVDDAAASWLGIEDQYARELRPKSVLCLPIYRSSEVIGALYLENNLLSGAFTPERITVIDFLASQTSVWLENARLYARLRRNEVWLREAQRLSSTGSFCWWVSSDTFELSDQAFRTYDLDSGAVVTLDALRQRTHPNDVQTFQQIVELARGAAPGLNYQFRLLLPDKSVRYLHLVAYCTREPDGQILYIGAIQDVTSSHQTEQALRRAQAELAHVAPRPKPQCPHGFHRTRGQPATPGDRDERIDLPQHAGCRSSQHRWCAEDRREVDQGRP